MPQAPDGETLDLRGIPCPANAARALIRIATMSEGERLEILLDAGEPMENVPPALEEEGHAIVERRAIDEASWAVVVLVGDD